ncbi:unnamed protein product [Enterobius vermicularis]|uniref:Uncharacterized protein n=1 Tax=Enterobius vermicularis TaxID=51028 RepID=A0A0N4VQF6_ENTVE|nr:unnamed protein product [Enterobius vermicularis]
MEWGRKALSSPYRLYRPYQIECPEATFQNNSNLLYRNANLDVLVEVNKRARSLERAVSYQKVLATIQDIKHSAELKAGKGSR